MEKALACDGMNEEGWFDAIHVITKNEWLAVCAAFKNDGIETRGIPPSQTLRDPFHRGYICVVCQYSIVDREKGHSASNRSMEPIRKEMK